MDGDEMVIVVDMFESFDEDIGVDGYYKFLRSKLFPSSTSSSVDVAAFPLVGQIFRKGSTFSRVRYLSRDQVPKFINGQISIDDFYPPKAHKMFVRQGRFNAEGSRTLYLADHPFVAMKECNIAANDYFLLSYIKLSVDMRFVCIEEGKNEFTDLVYRLLGSKDERFYSVINKVNDDIFALEGFQGIVYRSTKLASGYTDQTWGVISSTKNIAVSGAYIKDTELSVSWLSYCDELSAITHQALFRPLSNKKKRKIARITHLGGRSLFARECEKIMAELNEASRKNKLLLDKGYYSEFNDSPIKILWK